MGGQKIDARNPTGKLMLTLLLQQRVPEIGKHPDAQPSDWERSIINHTRFHPPVARCVTRAHKRKFGPGGSVSTREEGANSAASVGADDAGTAGPNTAFV
jgi:hypothetical protein